MIKLFSILSSGEIVIFRFRDMQAILSDFDEMLNRIRGRTGDTPLNDVVSEITTLCVRSTIPTSKMYAMTS
jgi:hypothetical protein